MKLRADRKGPDALRRASRIVGLGHDRARADLAERLLVARPAQPAGHVELFREFQRRIAEDRIFLVGRGQPDDRQRIEPGDRIAAHVIGPHELRVARLLVGEKAADHPFEPPAARRGQPDFLRPFLEPEVEVKGRDAGIDRATRKQRKQHAEGIARILHLTALRLAVGGRRGQRCRAEIIIDRRRIIIERDIIGFGDIIVKRMAVAEPVAGKVRGIEAVAVRIERLPNARQLDAQLRRRLPEQCRAAAALFEIILIGQPGIVDTVDPARALSPGETAADRQRVLRDRDIDIGLRTPAETACILDRKTFESGANAEFMRVGLHRDIFDKAADRTRTIQRALRPF